MKIQFPEFSNKHTLLVGVWAGIHFLDEISSRPASSILTHLPRCQAGGDKARRGI